MNWLRSLAAIILCLSTIPETWAEPPSSPAPRAEATRAVILNFGPPDEWHGEYGDVVGVQIVPEVWREAIPLLEKDRVSIVVARVRTGGGDERTVTAFHELFTNEFSPRFRVVFWVDQAIQSYVGAPLYVLSAREMYVTPKGLFGTALGFRACPLTAVRDPRLEERIQSAERASKEGGRPPELGRAFMIQTPLSVSKKQDGSWDWRSDETGTDIINRAGNICTIDAATAVRYGLAKGVASSRDELARAMGLERVEWVGQEASSAVLQSIRARDAEANQIQKRLEQYTKLVEGWNPETPPSPTVLADARLRLDAIRKDVEQRPAVARVNCVDDQWVANENKRLDDLGRPASSKR